MERCDDHARDLLAGQRCRYAECNLYGSAGAGVKGTLRRSTRPFILQIPMAILCCLRTRTGMIYANFSNNVNPMVAVGTDLSNMQFKNVCGVIVVRVSADATVPF